MVQVGRLVLLNIIAKWSIENHGKVTVSHYHGDAGRFHEEIEYVALV